MSTLEEIKTTLQQLQIKSSYTGYDYVIDGILLSLQNKDCLIHITKSLYVDIAIKHKTSVNCVERNIRTVVNAIWNTTNTQLLKEICDGTIPKRPTNTEFFLLMYLYFSKKTNALNYINPIEKPCPVCNQPKEICLKSQELNLIIENIHTENDELQDTITRIHDLIWKLLNH